VFLTELDDGKIAEKVFRPDGEELAEMAAWLMATTGAKQPGQIQIAIEIPLGPLVEALIKPG
jgi:hypothetical protein